MERNEELIRTLRHVQVGINKALRMLTGIRKGEFTIGEELQGIVKWFSTERGYGFLEIKNRGDLFVHYTEIVGEGYRVLHEGELVSCTVKQGQKGFEASGVRVLQET
jgi:CspA family cold shock protein